MMIDCPKCGFHQPKDEFCAKCGIDMYVFGLERKKHQKRRFGFFTMSGIGLVSILLVYLIASRNSKIPTNIQELASDISDLPGAVADSSRLLAARVSLKNLPTESQVSANAPVGSRNPQVEAQAKSALPTVTAEALLSDSKAGGVESRPVHLDGKRPSDLHLQFILVDTAFAERLAQDSHDKKSDGDLEFGIHSSLSTLTEKLKTETIQHDILQRDRYSLEEGKLINLAEELDGLDLGMRLVITPVHVKDDVLSLQIESFFYSSKEEKSRPNHYGRVAIDVSVKEGFWMRGVLPRQIQLQGEMAEAAGRYRILNALSKQEVQFGSQELLLVAFPK